LTHVVQQNGSQPVPTFGRAGLSHSNLSYASVQRHVSVAMLQRQRYQDCTPARTGQAGQTQAAIDSMVEDAKLNAHAWADNAVTVLTALHNGTATAAQQATLRGHFGTLTPAQINTLLTRFTQMRTRLANVSLIICNSAGSFFCRPPRGWCAYTDCPTSGAFTHLCPPFFQSPPPCVEPDRTSIMLHEAARAAGACGRDVQQGAGYPPANSLTNVFSYSGFARAVSRRAPAVTPSPTVEPPVPERPRFPSLIEEIERAHERRIRERVLESLP
jgi:hypothetical protein